MKLAVSIHLFKYFEDTNSVSMRSVWVRIIYTVSSQSPLKRCHQYLNYNRATEPELHPFYFKCNFQNFTQVLRKPRAQILPVCLQNNISGMSVSTHVFHFQKLYATIRILFSFVQLCVVVKSNHSQFIFVVVLGPSPGRNVMIKYK